MKKSLAFYAVASLLSFGIVSGLPGAPIPGAVSNATLALTLNRQVHGTVDKDSKGKPIKVNGKTVPDSSNSWTLVTGNKTVVYSEQITKYETTKYGNKELLEDLLTRQIIQDTTIKGWSLKMATAGGSPVPKFYVVKTGKTSVDISTLIALTDPLATAFTTNSHSTQTTVGNAPTVERTTGQNAFLGSTGVTIFPLVNERIDLNGGLNGSHTVGSTKSKAQVIRIKYDLPVLVGTYTAPGQVYHAAGSLKISMGAPTDDVSSFPNVGVLSQN